ncbi:ECF transporter S component [Feifania hominis]|uniref:ECF transporter S component n=1 Tax=Feifania hominis TaxID=2763660 RepID=A0A926HUE6_9FIRM|nr:ECF transporter S component [Feifania hominis]MBC8535865.1 ECF transporter S component [Feifania hominis]
MKQRNAMILTGLCIALGVVLPIAFHTIPNAGTVFLPMHIPVLLCGLACGPLYGLACGILAPLLSHFTTGMPPAAILPSMLCELAVYGLMAGLLLRLVKTRSKAANLYVSLIGAMLVGRVVLGLLNTLIFRAGAYSMQVWLTAAFVTALPGIVIQLIAVPVVYYALEKAKLLP